MGLLTRSHGHRAYAAAIKSPSTNVGILAGFAEEPFARVTILEGMREVIADRYRTFTAFSAPATELNAYLDLDASAEASPGGLILLPPRDADLNALREFRRNRPVVLIDQMIPGFEADFVGFQDFEAGYHAARHLYSLGHRRITFLGDEGPTTAKDRRRGVDSFCREASIEFSWNFSGLANGHRPPEGYVEAVFGLVRQNWPTAAVCTNDETAAAIMVSLARVGIHVPGDLALVGFGNAHTSLLNALDLTTMAQPYIELGREALALIAERFQGSVTGEVRELRLPMHLVRRGSCGAGLPTVAA